MDRSRSLIGGIEGGASHSTCVLLGGDGDILAEAKGPGTNHWIVGNEECQNRIREMVDNAKELAHIPLNQPLTALGLSLSGCEQEESNIELKKGLMERFPNLTEKCVVGSDTEGSIKSTSKNGGIVIIAGTGSNTLLINPDGKKYQCGGWGNFMGDEGSAWKIAHSAIKCIFNDMDNLEKAPYCTDWVWSTIKEHFQVEDRLALLDHFYKNFNKPFFASLCLKLSIGANDGDKLAQYFFVNSGRDIARSLNAVILKADHLLKEDQGGVHVLCVGSLWKSWNLLESGFIKYINAHTTIEEFTLMLSTTTMAVGAAYMAADALTLPLKRDYSKNYTVFYHFKRGADAPTNGVSKKGHSSKCPGIVNKMCSSNGNL